MIYYDNIPLSQTLYEQVGAYYWVELMRHKAETISVLRYGDSRFRVSWINKELPKKVLTKWRQDMNVDPKTFHNMNSIQFNGFEGHYLTAMPFAVWDKFAKVARELKIGPRKTAARVFIYLYYWSMRFQGSFSHPRELMVNALRIQKDNLAEALEWLAEKGLIIRSDYSKQEHYARRYYIPEELWNNQCKKEWQNMQKSLKR